MHLSCQKRACACECRELAARQDRKGKGRAQETSHVSLQHGLEVVLELLGSRVCRRSNMHLEQALHLVDVLLQGAKVCSAFSPLHSQSSCILLLGDEQQCCA